MRTSHPSPLYSRLTLVNSQGLHARAAATFVRIAQGLNVEIWVRWDGRTANGLSVLDLMALGAPCGSVLEVEVHGHDAEAALAALTKAVENRFDEE
jgi:phosphocarrier protein HPr